MLLLQRAKREKTCRFYFVSCVAPSPNHHILGVHGLDSTTLGRAMTASIYFITAGNCSAKWMPPDFEFLRRHVIELRSHPCTVVKFHLSVEGGGWGAVQKIDRSSRSHIHQQYTPCGVAPSRVRSNPRFITFTRLRISRVTTQCYSVMTKTNEPVYMSSDMNIG